MYREAVITFIDILGFKDIIQKSSADDVSSMLEKIKYFSDVNDSEDGEGYKPKVIQFSDSIIRIRPLDSKENEAYRYGILFHELNDLVLMQGSLAANGILVRGGVTVGDIFFDSDNRVYGQGFNRAYELESQFAIYPRIIIDPVLISNAKTDSRLLSWHNDLDFEFDYINRQLRIGSDGLYYVDYLGKFPDELDSQEYIPEFFDRIKQLILSKIDSLNGLTPVSVKYMWLANYYNEIIESKFHRHEDTEDLWITDKELPLLSRLT